MDRGLPGPQNHPKVVFYILNLNLNLKITLELVERTFFITCTDKGFMIERGLPGLQNRDQVVELYTGL